MNTDLLDDGDIVNFDADINDLGSTADLQISDDARRLDMRRKIEQLLEMKALKELDEDIEWWYPDL